MIVQSYISRTVFSTILLAVFFVVSVDCIFALVRELRSTGSAQYTIFVAMQYIGLTLPRRIYDMFPMACLLGSLMGLGLLASHSELIVMRASGVSMGRIAWGVLRVGLLITVVLTIIGEFVVPKSEFAADLLRATARGRGTTLLTAQGAWLRDNSSFIYVTRVLPDGRMQGVLRYEFDNTDLKRTSFSQEAIFEDDKWVLYDTAQTSIFSDHTTVQTIESMTWDTDVSPDLLTVLVTDPQDLSLRGLYSYIHYLRDNELDTQQYDLVFWKKVTQPFASIVMVFLAVPFIFGPLRSVSMGFRIVTGIVSGFAYYILSELFGPLAVVYEFPPLLAALGPPMIFALLAIGLLRRTY